MTSLIHEWRNAFERELADVEHHLNRHSNFEEDVEYHLLVQWLLQLPPSDRLDLLPEHPNISSNVFEANHFLSSLHHALVDDGEVSYVCMYNGNTLETMFITLRDRFSDLFDSHCRTLCDNHIRRVHASYDSFLRMQKFASEKGLPLKRTMMNPVDIRFKSSRDGLAFMQLYQDWALTKHHQTYCGIQLRNKKPTFELSGSSAIELIIPTLLVSP